MTSNADKFKDTYGVDPGLYHCVLSIPCKICKYANENGHPTNGCYLKFWNDEYGASFIKEDSK
jgi:hypothetical protein